LTLITFIQILILVFKIPAHSKFPCFYRVIRNTIEFSTNQRYITIFSMKVLKRQKSNKVKCLRVDYMK
jgi:hypothetical protein